MIIHGGWYRGELFVWADRGQGGRLEPAGGTYLQSALGRILSADGGSLEAPRPLTLTVPGPSGRVVSVRVPAIHLVPMHWLPFFAWCRHGRRDGTGRPGPELDILACTYALGLSMVAGGAFVPGLDYHLGYHRAVWHPLTDPDTESRVARLAARLPDVARALDPEPEPAATLLGRFLAQTVDTLIRRAAPQTAAPLPGPYGHWLSALGEPVPTALMDHATVRFLDAALHAWGQERRRIEASPWRLFLRVEEPVHDPGDWHVRLLVAPRDRPEHLLPLASAPIAETAPLLERARAASPLLAAAAYRGDAAEFSLSSHDLVAFVDRDGSALAAGGITVLFPAWWARRRRALHVRARLSTPREPSASLGDLATVDWTLALGNDPLTPAELTALAQEKAALVRLRGEWVELNEDIRRWARRLDGLPATLDTFGALKLGFSGAIRIDDEEVEVEQVDVGGWMRDLGRLREEVRAPLATHPSPAFRGTLRPYQLTGLAWLDLLHRLGLGALLADDMGLGKTVQTLALIDRDVAEGLTDPVLLVAPTSVVENWQQEAARFTPAVPVMIHQGAFRLGGEAFLAAVARAKLVVTSYPVLRADADLLAKVPWDGVILDEAQNIKNAGTRQATVARRLRARFRIALTGTPIENRADDLWSLMHFLNPGLLDEAANRDRLGGEATLRRLAAPFMLRRVKTDPAVRGDLPDKVEVTERCRLTREQASLYQAVLDQMNRDIDLLTGIRRRGAILATLTRLKQVLNHPAHFLGDNSPLAGRSGKLARMDELLEEILANGDRALIFTQFAAMGRLLARYLEERWGERALFLHGGTPERERAGMVEAFQTDPAGPRLFILSLKAGGTGLNLTVANHVIHYDRWWNPAVENQATDRAYRIGQHRNVTVHKLLSSGTLEEHIDRMLGEKKALAERIMGRGESWLADLSTEELQRILALTSDDEEMVE